MPRSIYIPTTRDAPENQHSRVRLYLFFQWLSKRSNPPNMSSGSTTIAQTVPSFSTDDPLYSSANLPSSFSSLPSSSFPSSSSRGQTSQIAKTYRQAAHLFLTKRFPEALSTIEPIITPQPASSEPSPPNEHDIDDDDDDDGNGPPPSRLAP